MTSSLGEITKEKLNHISQDNVNVTGVSPEIYSNNVNVTKVRYIARKLSVSLKDSDSYDFFCKVAWTLSEGYIWSNLEVAMKKRKPAAYFTYMCRLAMEATL